jgi:hypothetical protein
MLIGNLGIPSTRRSVSVPPTVIGASASFHIEKRIEEAASRGKLSMIIGDGAKRLEQRITTALYGGGRLSSRESGFLQSLLRKIELYRDRAFVSDGQASWLFTILTRLEQGATDRPYAHRRKSRSAPSLQPSPDDASKRLCPILAGLDNVVWPDEEKPEGFDISEAIELDREI